MLATEGAANPALVIMALRPSGRDPRPQAAGGCGVPGKLSNPRDVALHGLGALLWVERMLAFEVPPKLVRTVEDGELREALERHLEETRTHAARVEQAFRRLSAEPSSNRSAAPAALTNDAETVSASIVDPGLRDLHVAWAAVRTARIEVALYAALDASLDALAAGDAVELLRKNREDEQRVLTAAEAASERLAADRP